MKKIFLSLAAAMTMLAACTDKLEQRLDSLEDKVSKLEATVNQDAQTLADLIESIENNVYVVSYEETATGYELTLSDNTTITINHGQNSADAAVPAIGVELIDGKYYWTVNGETIKDGSGNNVPVHNDNCPKFKKEDGQWYISADGTNWEPVSASSSLPFTDFSATETTVSFKVGDQTITLPRAESAGAAEFELKISNTSDIAVLPYGQVTLTYEIVGASEDTQVYLVPDQGWQATLGENNTIVITAPYYVNGRVLVFAGDSKHAAMVVLTFEEGTISVAANTYNVAKEGGNVTLAITTNLDYEVEVAADAQSWISVAPATRATREETVTLQVAANDGLPRSGQVSLKVGGSAIQTITVNQESGVEAPYSLEDVTGTWSTASGNWVIEASEGNGTNVKISTMYGYANSSINANFDEFAGTLAIATPQQGVAVDGGNYYLYLSYDSYGYYYTRPSGYNAGFKLSDDKQTLNWTSGTDVLEIYATTMAAEYGWGSYQIFSGESLVLTRPGAGGNEGGEEGGEGGDVDQSVPAVVGTWTVSYTDSYGSSRSFDMPIVASDDDSKGNVILKRWMSADIQDMEVSIYANYSESDKTLTIAMGQSLTMFATILAEVNYDYPNSVTFTVNDDATQMTIDSGTKFGDRNNTNYGSGYSLTKKQ